MGIKIIAHRGLGPTSQFTAGINGKLPDNLEPENTLSSFQKSLEHGADGIECDVCASADGQPMVIHNNRLNKNVYQAERNAVDLGFVDDLTKDALQRMKNHQPQFHLGNNQFIPTLNDLLDLVINFNQQRKQKQLPDIVVNIELKRKGSSEASWRVVQDYIQQGKISAESIVYCSFDLDSLVKIRELDKSVNAHSKIAATLHTEFLYGDYHVIPPNWFVPFQYHYKDDAINILQGIHDSYDLYAVDAEYWDVEPELIEFVQKNNITLHNWPSYKEPRVLNEGIVHNIIQLKDNLNDIYFKVDSPEDAVAYFNKVKSVYQTFSLNNVTIEDLQVLNSIPADEFKYLPHPNSNEAQYHLVQMTGIEKNKGFIVVGMMADSKSQAISNKIANGNIDLHQYIETIIYLDDDNCIESDVYLNLLRFYSKRYVGKPISV